VGVVEKGVPFDKLVFGLGIMTNACGQCRASALNHFDTSLGEVGSNPSIEANLQDSMCFTYLNLLLPCEAQD